MSKMRYGPRFSQQIASVSIQTDDPMYQDMMHDITKIKAIQAAQPLYKKELREHKAGKKIKKMHADRRAENHRYEAEQRMAETVREVVAMLEFGMSDLMQHRLITGRPKLVCQNAIHNIIYTLRNKCGVSFDRNPEYEHVLNQDYRRSQQQQGEDVKAEIEQQRLSRLRNNREIAERIAAKHNARLS